LKVIDSQSRPPNNGDISKMAQRNATVLCEELLSLKQAARTDTSQFTPRTLARQ